MSTPAERFGRIAILGGGGLMGHGIALARLRKSPAEVVLLSRREETVQHGLELIENGPFGLRHEQPHVFPNNFLGVLAKDFFGCRVEGLHHSRFIDRDNGTDRGIQQFPATDPGVHPGRAQTRSIFLFSSDVPQMEPPITPGMRF